MNNLFPVDLAAINERVNSIDPLKYGKTRNYLDGAVTKLSPYISRGVLSTASILRNVLRRGYRLDDIEQFVNELLWREYFSRRFFADYAAVYKRKMTASKFFDIPEALLSASTGIVAIDRGIQELTETGYMHNHMRMYVAMLIANVAGLPYSTSAAWIYYHLLDADCASNTLSWDWVAGVRNGKKYFANQENINRYCYTNQKNSFLDVEYEQLSFVSAPAHLHKTVSFEPIVSLPLVPLPNINPALPTLVYTPYNLDPHWYAAAEANRVLLLEPSLFYHYPMSSKTIDFILGLSVNIPNIQVFCGEFENLMTLGNGTTMIFKNHPLMNHFKGKGEEYETIVPPVEKDFPSFFAFRNFIRKHQLLSDF